MTNKDYVYLLEVERSLGRYSRKNGRDVKIYDSYKKAYSAFYEAKRKYDNWLISSTEYGELYRDYKKHTSPQGNACMSSITIEESVVLYYVDDPLNDTNLFIKYRLTKKYIF